MWQTRFPNYAQYGLSPGMRTARQLSQAAQAQPVANWGTVAAQLMSGFLQSRDVRQQRAS